MTIANCSQLEATGISLWQLMAGVWTSEESVIDDIISETTSATTLEVIYSKALKIRKRQVSLSGDYRSDESYDKPFTSESATHLYQLSDKGTPRCF